MTNTWLAHMDEVVWNTKGGERPLDQFWAERFLVDPRDKSSGPTRKRVAPSPEDADKTEAYFCSEGLEGAWIPYGGTPPRPISRYRVARSAARKMMMVSIDKVLTCARRRSARMPRTPVGETDHALVSQHGRQPL